MIIFAQAIETTDAVFKLHVDLGQVLIMGVMGLVGYLVKKMIDGITDRLDKVEERMFNLSNELQRIIGQVQGWNGSERRHGKFS